MHKQEMIDGLKNYKATWKGQRAFADFFAHWLRNLKIPSDEKYDFWRIEPYLPQLAVDAFDALRTGTDEDTVQFRKDYEAETGHEVPNITDPGASHILHQGSAVQTTLGFMLRDITGNEWVACDVDAYCNAQMHLLQQTFDKFLRLVYRKGLGEMADKCSGLKMCGKFGKTELRTDRIIFTFAKRINKNKPNYYKQGKGLHYNEWAVSFVGTDEDPLYLSAGIHSVDCDLRTALDMINEVIKHWPADVKQQNKLFKANAEVSIA